MARIEGGYNQKMNCFPFKRREGGEYTRWVNWKKVDDDGKRLDLVIRICQ
jgi:hypothetical protein